MILGTRLALIQYNKTVATGLLLMSLMRLVLLYLNWYFWLERWKNIMRHFIDELALNLISSSDAINRTLATILTILIHDCIHKDGLNHIAFKKYKAEKLAEVSDQYRRYYIVLCITLIKFLKLFYFSRYKPPGLQMTPIQILIPLTDVLFIIVAMIDICKQVQFKRNDGIIESHNKLKLGQMSICLVGSSFCLFAYGKACG